MVADERTGRILHFVEKPETFVSDLINCGVYVFSPSVFTRMPAEGVEYSMNELLPAMAHEEQLHSMLLSGYWVRDRPTPHLRPRVATIHAHTRAHTIDIAARSCCERTTRSTHWAVYFATPNPRCVQYPCNRRQTQLFFGQIPNHVPSSGCSGAHPLALS